MNSGTCLGFISPCNCLEVCCLCQWSCMNVRTSNCHNRSNYFSWRYLTVRLPFRVFACLCLYKSYYQHPCHHKLQLINIVISLISKAHRSRHDERSISYAHITLALRLKFTSDNYSSRITMAKHMWPVPHSMRSMICPACQTSGGDR